MSLKLYVQNSSHTCLRLKVYSGTGHMVTNRRQLSSLLFGYFIIKFANSTNAHCDYFSGNVEINSGIVFNRSHLICITTGGPATTITWNRDSISVGEGSKTVLDDPETAQYTHTLAVTTAGNYTIKVSNNKPSFASDSISIGMAYV